MMSMAIKFFLKCLPGTDMKGGRSILVPSFGGNCLICSNYSYIIIAQIAEKLLWIILTTSNIFVLAKYLLSVLLSVKIHALWLIGGHGPNKVKDTKSIFKRHRR